MKIINSPVRAPSLDRLLAGCSKAGTIATLKKTVRKQERARIRQFARRELDQDLLLVLAEKKDIARRDRESSYKDLMRKAMSGKPSRRQPMPSSGSMDRVEFRIQQQSRPGDGQFAVLASCAMSE